MEPITITAHVAFKSRPTYRPDDSKGIVFSIVPPDELRPFLRNPDKNQISCEARMWKGLKWGQMGHGAELRLTGTVEVGPRGGEKFHCSAIEIITGAERTPAAAKLPAWLKKQMKEAKALDKKKPQLSLF